MNLGNSYVLAAIAGVLVWTVLTFKPMSWQFDSDGKVRFLFSKHVLALLVALAVLVLKNMMESSPNPNPASSPGYISVAGGRAPDLGLVGAATLPIDKY